MFSTRWQLFRLRGIPIRIDISWLIIAALLSWTLAEQFHAMIPELSAGSSLIMGLVAALTFFLCIVLHELGHALVAQRVGIPLEGITLFLFGGVAEMRGEPNSAGAEFFMAVAGPVVSIVLAALFGLLTLLGGLAGWAPAVVVIFKQLAMINLMVLLFNLVPAFPLDGGRVFRSILWAVLGDLRRATYWASLCGRGFAALLITLGVLLFLTRNPVAGIWLFLIGLFLKNAAEGSYQQVLIRQVLAGEPVRRFMNPEPVVVPPTIDLRTWVEDYVYHYHYKTFPVATDGHGGVISTSLLSRYSRSEWNRHTVGEAMRTDLEPIRIAPEADALQALEQMQRTGASRLLVLDKDRLVGIVSLKDLLRFLQLKLELEAGAEEEESRPSGYWHGPSRHQTPSRP
jgi:Zn-dependent protease